MTKPLPMAMANIVFCLLLLSLLIASPLESARIVQEQHRAHIAAGDEAPDRHVFSDGFGAIKRAQLPQFAPPAPQANQQRDPPTSRG
ncbi:unnamed protein product [Alopecurus aequalis]